MQPRWKLAIFDFNGTMVNDFWVSYAGVRAIFQFYGLTPPSKQTYRNEATHNYMQFYYRHGIPQKTQAEDLLRIWHEVVKTHWHQTKLHRGVHKTLRYCKKFGMKTAIVSGQEEKILHPQLAQFHLKDLFDYVLGGVRINKTVALLKAINQFQVEPYDAFYLDDTFDGIREAKRAGLYAFAFTKGYSSRERLAQAWPDDTIGSYKKLRIAIEVANWVINNYEGGRR